MIYKPPMPKTLGRRYSGQFDTYIEEVVFDLEPDEAVELQYSDAQGWAGLFRGDLTEDVSAEGTDLTEEELDFLADYAKGGVIVESLEKSSPSFAWFKDSGSLEDAWEDMKDDAQEDDEDALWENEGDEDIFDMDFDDIDEDEDEESDDADQEGDESDDEESEEEEDFGFDDEESEDDEDEEKEERKGSIQPRYRSNFG